MASQEAPAKVGGIIAVNQIRNLRACKICSILQTREQWKARGCPNCEQFLELQGKDAEAANDKTSRVWEGMMYVTDTEASWVARWLRLKGYVPGLYATKVEGTVDEGIIASMSAEGVVYVPRDGSMLEETEMIS